MNLKTKSRYFTSPKYSTFVELLGKPLWIAGNIFMEHYQNLSLTDIEGEIWKQIGDTQAFVSNFGRVKVPPYYTRIGKFMLPERIKKQQKCKGYKIVQIKKKSYFTHRLVAQAFIPNPLNKPQVNHKDFVKHNNHVDNLEWATQEDNHLHAVLGGKATLSMKTAKRKTVFEPLRRNITYVYLDNGEFYKKYNNFKEVYKELKITAHAIKKVLDKSKAHLGFVFSTKKLKEVIVEKDAIKPITVKKIYYVRKQPNENGVLLARKPIKAVSRQGKEITFESISEAARHFNSKSKHLSKAMKRNNYHREHKFYFIQKESPKETQLHLF